MCVTQVDVCPRRHNDPTQGQAWRRRLHPCEELLNGMLCVDSSLDPGGDGRGRTLLKVATSRVSGQRYVDISYITAVVTVESECPPCSQAE
jgi:hypothetical protein